MWRRAALLTLRLCVERSRFNASAQIHQASGDYLASWRKAGFSCWQQLKRVQGVFLLTSLCRSTALRWAAAGQRLGLPTLDPADGREPQPYGEEGERWCGGRERGWRGGGESFLLFSRGQLWYRWARGSWTGIKFRSENRANSDGKVWLHKCCFHKTRDKISLVRYKK